MRIVLLGAGGFIGRHVLAELLTAGHDVVAVVRRAGNLAATFAEATFTELDLAHAISAGDWIDILAGADCVVNAAGLLRGSRLQAVHVDMPRAFYEAARKAGVARGVLISAISARPDVVTDYSLTKLAGEDVLRKSGLDCTILRPSLVYGDGSFGGTSLMRGMAGLPWVVPLPGQGAFPFTPIHARDLARTVRKVCEDDRFSGITLEPVGPETMTLRELLCCYREWLGFGLARFVSIPLLLMRLLGRVGDVLGDGPVSTTSLDQMIAGNAGDSAAFFNAIGFEPAGLRQSLRERPAQVQDRWHARLFFLAPVLTVVLALTWLASAWLGLAHGTRATAELVHALGLPGVFSDPLRIGGSGLDIVVAALVVFDRRGRWSTPVQLLVVCGYTLVIGLALPDLWLDPLGPLLKNLPILAAIAVHGAIVDKR